MAEGARFGLGLLAALACAAVLGAGGCASGPPRATEADLTLMLTMLPGRYDNGAQAQADLRTGAHPAHESVALLIMHVYTPRLGHYVYYAQESAGDNPRRILGQKMYSFQLDEKRGIVETLYVFVEPGRWRDGAELCQLIWKKQGEGFVAAHDPKACPDSASAAVSQAELTAGALSSGDYKFVRKGR